MTESHVVNLQESCTDTSSLKGQLCKFLPSHFMVENIGISLYVSLHSLLLHMSRIRNQVNFLNGVLQVLIQSFPSPRPAAILRLKSTVCPTIYREICWVYIFPRDISAM